MGKSKKNLKWIGSLGGPSIIIGARQLELWSGTGSIDGAKNGIYEEVGDTVNSNLCHYGLACEIKDQIGTIRVNEKNEEIIVIADLPDLMTVIEESRYGNKMIVKWDYGESEEEFESFLNYENLDGLKDWTHNFNLQIENDKFYLLDATASGFDLYGQDVIIFYLDPGNYKISSMDYKPNKWTSILLHRIKKE